MLNIQSQKSKEPINNSNQNNKKYDLEERTLITATKTIELINKLPNTLTGQEIKKQLFRSSASIGANYREANEGLGKKDFIFRLKICRKEAKESIYWLKLLENDNKFKEEIINLTKEIKEYVYIFTAIINKMKNNF